MEISGVKRKFRPRDVKRVEKKILTCMILSEDFLKHITSIFNPNYVQGPITRRIMQWVLDYYFKYGKAPGKAISDIYQSKVRNQTLSDDEITSIERYIVKLDEDLENDPQIIEEIQKSSLDVYLDISKNYFAQNSLYNLSQDIQEALLNETPHQAEEILAKYKRVEIPRSSGVFLFEDSQVVQDAFERQSQPLFKLPGALGQLMNEDLCQESFVAFMGREKIGKTWILMEMAYRAARSRLNVAFFQAGDMSEHQQIKRFCARVSSRPLKKKYAGINYIPTLDCWRNQLDMCNLEERVSQYGVADTKNELIDILYNMENGKRRDQIEDIMEDGYVPCVSCKKERGAKRKNFQGSVWYKKKELSVLNWVDAQKQGQQFIERMGGRRIKISTHANGTLSVRAMEGILDVWEHFDQFVPQVIIVDYPDIMIHEENDFRQMQNKIWQGLRALAQTRRCLVIVVTQADAASYKQRSLSLSNFSEDKRKYSHVTSFFSLNQETGEKRAGVMRVGALLMREDDFEITREAKILQHLSSGRPLITSYF